VVINQRFYTSIRLHQVLTISGFHFHCFQLPAFNWSIDACYGVSIVQINARDPHGNRQICALYAINACLPRLLVCQTTEWRHGFNIIIPLKVPVHFIISLPLLCIESGCQVLQTRSDPHQMNTLPDG